MVGRIGEFQGTGRRVHGPAIARNSTKRACVMALAAFSVAIGAASEASAQCASGFTTGFFTRQSVSLGGAVSGGVGVAGALISSINTANTALLTQSSAFVSAPPNPKPDSEGGGVWVRGVGGQLDFKNNATINFVSGGGGGASGSAACNSKFNESFGGVQVGQDVSRLNLMGWNVHLGMTAGYMQTHGSADGLGAPFSADTQIPFAGSYLVATNGAFFAEALVRYTRFETSLNSAANSLFDQKLDSRGLSAAGSLGYHWNIPNSTWFLEPSVGVVWSRTEVDPLNIAVTTGGGGLGAVGTLQFNDIDSTIGRLGLRFGTTIESGNMIYQPFAAVSVWHEFGSNITGNFATCCSAIPATASIISPNIGTYGQYSLGVNGQMANTGWLGFVRGDYRNGNQLEGWDVVGGIRYQFTPDAVLAARAELPNSRMYTKAVKAPPPVVQAYNWTGLYIGAFGGAAFGRATMDFPGVLSDSPRQAGGLAGGTIGYNYQINTWVLGVEADAGWTNLRGSSPCAGAAANTKAFPLPPLFDTDCHATASWLGTVTGRIGYAWGRALIYAKAGGAWTHADFSVVCDLPASAGVPCRNAAGAPISQLSASGDRFGWTAGYGVEFALTQQWSAKGEWDYIDFGNKSFTLADGSAMNAKLHVTEAKIGVNYRFRP